MFLQQLMVYNHIKKTGVNQICLRFSVGPLLPPNPEFRINRVHTAKVLAH